MGYWVVALWFLALFPTEGNSSYGTSEVKSNVALTVFDSVTLDCEDNTVPDNETDGSNVNGVSSFIASCQVATQRFVSEASDTLGAANTANGIRAPPSFS